MNIARKIHLWLGIILSLILFVEAATGLILSEPRIIGIEKQGRAPHTINSPLENSSKQEVKKISPNNKPAEQGMNAFAIAKQLHQGKLGDLNAKWLIDLSAIGLIILIITGIYIAIPLLRASKQRYGRR